MEILNKSYGNLKQILNKECSLGSLPINGSSFLTKWIIFLIIFENYCIFWKLLEQNYSLGSLPINGCDLKRSWFVSLFFNLFLSFLFWECVKGNLYIKCIMIWFCIWVLHFWRKCGHIACRQRLQRILPYSNSVRWNIKADGHSHPSPPKNYYRSSQSAMLVLNG